VLSHPDREDRIHVLTVDGVLATDIQDRLNFDSRMRGCELVRPESEDPKAAIAEIECMAPDTVASRLLIIDVRSYTLPRLQHAYNKVVGYNRKDLNEYCYSVLIGDGPLSLFRAGKSPQVFLPHLARHRIDYYPAVFFYDPFLHYTEDERQRLGIEHGGELPQLVPKRLEKGFKGEDIALSEVREYFRAGTLSGDARTRALRRRQNKLAKIYRKRIAREFPHHKDQLQAWLTREGYRLAGEALSLHLYPFFFEDWVFDLLARARPGER
jgi:hypothetical protein